MKIKNFNKEYLKYLFPQRTRLTTEYSLNLESEQSQVDDSITTMVQKDFDMIKDFLPSNCNRILDIGCGLALIDIFLYKHYQTPGIYLLDKTELNTDKISGFNEKYKCYNSMEAAKETLINNGVDQNKINLYETTNYNDLFGMKFDIISSFLSCGWHFHVNTYINLMDQALSANGILILDIRHNTDQLEALSSRFVLEKQIYNYAESKHTGGNIGDRYIFKKKN